MKKLLSHLRKGKWISMTLIFIAITISCMFALSIAQINGVNSAVSGLNSWIIRHKYTFLVWHTLIIVAIYYFWGKKIDKVALSESLSMAQAKKMKQIRYLMIFFVILIDVLVHWY